MLANQWSIDGRPLFLDWWSLEGLCYIIEGMPAFVWLMVMGLPLNRGARRCPKYSWVGVSRYPVGGGPKGGSEWQGLGAGICCCSEGGYRRRSVGEDFRVGVSV